MLAYTPMLNHYYDERRHAQTNARQTVSGVWADQTLDICSKTFGMYYSLFAVVFLTQAQQLVNSLRFK